MVFDVATNMFKNAWTQRAAQMGSLIDADLKRPTRLREFT